MVYRGGNSLKKIIIILCLCWMGLIFFMSSNNGKISHQESNKMINVVKSIQAKLQIKDENKTINENKLDYVVRKSAHTFIYMMLAVLVSSIFFVFNKKGKNTIVYILFICLLFAVTDEFHQSFVPQRTSLVSDILFDFAGSLIGLALFYLAYYQIYARYAIKEKKSLKI